MIKSRNVVLFWFLVEVVICLLVFCVPNSTRYNESLADEPTPQDTIGASSMVLGPAIINNSTPYNVFNNGYSFVLYGTYPTNANGTWFFTTPTLNFDTQLLSMSVNFSNSNLDNNLSVLNVRLIGYDENDNGTVFFSLVGVNATSLNTYFNDKYITIDSSYTSIRFVFDIAVNSNYVEFAFNDFSIDFFSDFKLVYEEGFQEGYDTAKDEYFQSRYDLGYNAGFIEGSNNQFSFLSYFGAIIETPINAALSLFDFDFLGFNMRSFFLSVLTISMIVMIIKFVLAR